MDQDTIPLECLPTSRGGAGRDGGKGAVVGREPGNEESMGDGITGLPAEVGAVTSPRNPGFIAGGFHHFQSDSTNFRTAASSSFSPLIRSLMECFGTFG